MSRFETRMKFVHQYDINILSYIGFNGKSNSRMRAVRGTERAISPCPHRSVHVSLQLERRTFAMVEVRQELNS
jgi:hypothetical protein